MFTIMRVSFPIYCIREQRISKRCKEKKICLQMKSTIFFLDLSMESASHYKLFFVSLSLHWREDAEMKGKCVRVTWG